MTCNALKIELFEDIKNDKGEFDYVMCLVVHEGKEYKQAFTLDDFEQRGRVHKDFRRLGMTSEVNLKEFASQLHKASEDFNESRIKKITKRFGIHKSEKKGSEYVTATKTYCENKNPTIIHADYYKLTAKMRNKKKSKNDTRDLEQHLSEFLQNSDIGSLAVAAAFAGPINSLFKVTNDNPVFYMCGESTTGKTSAIKIAAGLLPESARTHHSNARFTRAGFEDFFVKANDNTAFIDELGKLLKTHSKNKIQDLIQFFANGSGTFKSQSQSIQENYPDAEWQLVILSSGEEDLSRYIGTETNTGASARFVIVPVPSADAGGILEGFGDTKERKELLDDLMEQITSADGIIWHRFLEKLFHDLPRWEEFVDGQKDKFLAFYPEASQIENRRLEKYALLTATGNMLIEMGLLELSKSHFTEVMDHLFEKAIEQTVSAGPDQSLRQVINSILAVYAIDGAIIKPYKKMEEIDFRDPTVKGFERKKEGKNRLMLKKGVLNDLLGMPEKPSLNCAIGSLEKAGVSLRSGNRESPFQQIGYTDSRGPRRGDQFLVIDLERAKAIHKSPSQLR